MGGQQHDLGYQWQTATRLSVSLPVPGLSVLLFFHSSVGISNHPPWEHVDGRYVEE